MATHRWDSLQFQPRGRQQTKHGRKTGLVFRSLITDVPCSRPRAPDPSSDCVCVRKNRCTSKTKTTRCGSLSAEGTHQAECSRQHPCFFLLLFAHAHDNTTPLTAQPSAQTLRLKINSRFSCPTLFATRHFPFSNTVVPVPPPFAHTAWNVQNVALWLRRPFVTAAAAAADASVGCTGAMGLTRRMHFIMMMRTRTRWEDVCTLVHLPPLFGVAFLLAAR